VGDENRVETGEAMDAMPPFVSIGGNDRLLGDDDEKKLLRKSF
jgi:hypothetical protein